MLERYLEQLMNAFEAACNGQRGGEAEVMTEAAVKAYLAEKARQPEISRALYLIAIDTDTRGLVEAAIQRAEQALASMLATARDSRFADPESDRSHAVRGDSRYGADVLRTRHPSLGRRKDREAVDDDVSLIRRCGG